MLKQIAIAAAYAKAPKATLMVRHPKKTVMALAVTQGLKESRTARRVVGGLVGLGAAAVALPVLAVLMLKR
jgi:hypothetical protein